MWTASARAQDHRCGARYASDVSDAEFALIAPLLPAPQPGGRPRTTALREVFNAILYLLRTGCPWRMLPKDFPPKSTVYGYFRRFGQEGVWHRIWMVLTMAAREQAGRRRRPAPAIVDSQSVKTTEAGGPRGFDAGKKINGRKRHLVTDTHGLPLALVVHPADVQDRDGLALVCARIRRRFPWLAPSVRRRRLSAAWSPPRPPRTNGCGWRSSTAPPDASGFAVLPRRWVIERSFAWLSRNRRLAKDFEQLTEAATAMVVVAIIQLLIRRLASP